MGEPSACLYQTMYRFPVESNVCVYMFLTRPCHKSNAITNTYIQPVTRFQGRRQFECISII